MDTVMLWSVVMFLFLMFKWSVFGYKEKGHKKQQYLLSPVFKSGFLSFPSPSK